MQKLQCKKISKFYSAFYGILFVMIPYKLIELHNFLYKILLYVNIAALCNCNISGQTGASYGFDLLSINRHAPAYCVMMIISVDFTTGIYKMKINRIHY